MPKFNVTRHVPYSAAQVYAVAGDVANYQAFLPLVKKSIVRGRKQLPGGLEVFDSELIITYKKLGIKETMSSQVTLDPATYTVVAASADGPLKYLNAEWKIITAGPNACDINFTVDYALKSRSLQFVLSGVFDMAVRKIMTAFEQRVKDLYENKAAVS